MKWPPILIPNTSHHLCAVSVQRQDIGWELRTYASPTAYWLYDFGKVIFGFKFHSLKSNPGV
jgi:hypothetical protein